MNKLPMIVVIGVGVVAGLAAVSGLFYNVSSLAVAFSGSFSGSVKEGGHTYFYPAFYIMSCICIACYILLLVCSVDLLCVRFRRFRLLTGVLVFEVVYLFFVSTLWLSASIGTSVAAATGVANGGLMVQFMILIPLWAPILVWWAKRKLEYHKPVVEQ
jgi:hypothetical protein